MLLLLLGCAALIHGGVGATGSLDDGPKQGNVSLQFDAGFSPVEAGEIIEPLSGGFGISGRSRVDDLGQLNDFGVHLFLVFGYESPLRAFLRSTLFSVAAYDNKANLLAPGLGVRGELGLLICPGEEGVYCLALQGNAEYDGWLGGDRPSSWAGGTLGIAVNWGEEL